MTLPPLGAGIAPVSARRGGAVDAELRDLDGRLVGWFRLEGGKHHGAIGPAEGQTLARLAAQATAVGAPIVGVVSSSGADVHQGLDSLHAWGRLARALADASGVVPIVMVVVGPCVSGPALLLGLADTVVMTQDAFAYVSGPSAVAAFTGHRISHAELGGPQVHATLSGVADLVVDDDEEALWAAADVLSYLPSHNLEEPPVGEALDDPERSCPVAARSVPEHANAAYDVRQVVADVVDRDSVLELGAAHAPNLVTALARVEGRPVGVVANQPLHMAGGLDVEGARKGARFVQWCDAFNIPLLTFVDTPGFQPGKDLEWRGMIRHGAKLVHAYAEATVPRVGVILRKAYGGAYIVMDSKRLGNDYCVAWPQAEIAVMGPSGAVRIVAGRRLAGMEDDAERASLRQTLEEEYGRLYCTPTIAAERGYVDDVIDPARTRAVVARALRTLATKREALPRRRHANGPL